ncbi:hypothetical protein DYB32_006088 [Aphanomyces invadans]|uniref:SCP2 domain-containing protein n=1 Tax=Aphanomyces invadans TaxID=157072 RepID=A0A418AVE2_9STRA|nr:hypothetical protein DYB32_006088 [Aphanomyces invadans]
MAAGAVSSLVPFSSLLVDLPPPLRKRIAEAYASTPPRSPPLDLDRSRRSNTSRVHVGYLSFDFNNHPTAHLMEGLFVHHNTSAFEVSAWSYGKGSCFRVRRVAQVIHIDDGSAYRQSIPSLTEHFVDVVLMGTNDAAAAIERARVEILVDAQGHTLGMLSRPMLSVTAIVGQRHAIVAAQPAPIIVNFLVYPGTSVMVRFGRRDVIMTMDGRAEHYTERLMLLPQSYQVNYYATYGAVHDPTPRPLFKRFAFANFNKLDKIEPQVFGVWMAVMRRVRRYFMEYRVVTSPKTADARSHKMSTASEVFATMDAAVREAGASLVDKVKGTIKFDVTGAGQWLIQVKTTPSGVSKATADDKADVTITISESNFLLLIAEKLNPQAAFMQGKIKLKGNMGLASKLAAVIAAYKQKAASSGSAPAAAASVPATPTSSAQPKLRSALLFASIGEAIKTKGPELVSKVKGTIQFVITPGNPLHFRRNASTDIHTRTMLGGAWHVDLKNGTGSIEATSKPADITITTSDDDFMAIAEGKLNAQQHPFVDYLMGSADHGVPVEHSRKEREADDFSESTTVGQF